MMSCALKHSVDKALTIWYHSSNPNIKEADMPRTKKATVTTTIENPSITKDMSFRPALKSIEDTLVVYANNHVVTTGYADALAKAGIPWDNERFIVSLHDGGGRKPNCSHFENKHQQYKKADHTGESDGDRVYNIAIPTQMLNTTDFRPVFEWAVESLVHMLSKELQLGEIENPNDTKGGYKDVSSRGAYHNATFKEIAEACGGVCKDFTDGRGYEFDGVTDAVWNYIDDTCSPNIDAFHAFCVQREERLAEEEDAEPTVKPRSSTGTDPWVCGCMKFDKSLPTSGVVRVSAAKLIDATCNACNESFIPKAEYDRNVAAEKEASDLGKTIKPKKSKKS